MPLYYRGGGFGCPPDVRDLAGLQKVSGRGGFCVLGSTGQVWRTAPVYAVVSWSSGFRISCGFSRV